MYLPIRFLGPLLLPVNILRGIYLVRCAIWYHLYNLKNVKNADEKWSLKNSFPTKMFFTFFTLYKWYQIVQNVSYFTINKILAGLMYSWLSTTSNFEYFSYYTGGISDQTFTNIKDFAELLWHVVFNLTHGTYFVF